MEEREIWIRLGCRLKGSADEIDAIVNGDHKKLVEVIQKGTFSIEGDSYIPESCIEDYNDDYGMHHEIKDVEFFI